VAVNPANPDNIIGVWQQDRWSDGGSNGLLTGVSHDGGATWIRTMAHFSRCSGGNVLNGGNYERASDPWVTISPNGTAYQISLSVNNSDMANAILVSKSTDCGNTWSEPITLINDTDPTVLNDKESITADPANSDFVYAVWDRVVFPNPHDRASKYEHSLAPRGPVMFSRTSDGGKSWERARIIFDPGENAQTVGNQIVVLPNGDLVNVFSLINVYENASGVRGVNVTVIRSTDKGVKWSEPVIVDKLLAVNVTDPDTGQPVRTGDIIPEDGGLTWTDPIKIDKMLVCQQITGWCTAIVLAPTLQTGRRIILQARSIWRPHLLPEVSSSGITRPPRLRAVRESFPSYRSSTPSPD